MITVDEAKQLISDHTILLKPVVVKLSSAVGHVLASAIYAKFDIPAFRQSAMDGYAFKFEDKNKELLLKGEMAAGIAHEVILQEGETIRIFTGAPLPEGADTVVMQEKVDVANGKVTLSKQDLKIGANVRGKGSEIKAGALAMEKGCLLSPAAIGFLAGIGVVEVAVFPMPKISIILTGNELQQPGLPLNFGQVYESNSYSLAAALRNEGITAIDLYRVADDLELLTKAIKTALETSDVILLTGGVSVGDYDYVVEATKRCAIEQIFHKVKQKPGKPLFFGAKKAKLVFGLPGNPSSVLSCYYNYVLPALKSLSGKESNVKVCKAELTHSYQKALGLTHFLKGNYQEGKVTPLQAQESYRLSSFAHANCLIRLDENQQVIATGENVTVMLLPN